MVQSLASFPELTCIYPVVQKQINKKNNQPLRWFNSPMPLEMVSFMNFTEDGQFINIT